MSSLPIYSDARTLLLAANIVPYANIEWANEPFTIPQTTNWLSVEAYSNVVGILDLGANHWRERGTLIVYCMAPTGTGTDSLRTLAKAVCNVFRNLPTRNPYYGDASIGTGGQSDDGMYFILPVTIATFYED